MTVVPMNSFSNAAAEKVTDFLALNGGGLGELLYFVCGDAALEPYYEALVAVDAPRPDFPRLREAIDRMIRHLEDGMPSRQEIQLDASVVWRKAH